MNVSIITSLRGSRAGLALVALAVALAMGVWAVGATPATLAQSGSSGQCEEQPFSYKLNANNDNLATVSIPAEVTNRVISSVCIKSGSQNQGPPELITFENSLVGTFPADSAMPCYTATLSSDRRTVTVVRNFDSMTCQGISNIRAYTVEAANPAQGCTPGYWKNHLGAWPPTGYTTGQKVNTVFIGAVPALGDSTLQQALDFRGGSTLAGAQQILLRAGVAALLSAAHPGVAYQFTTAQVIAEVNNALASTDRATILGVAATLDAANNQGCPLS
jgi:hypothetical protein